MRRTPSQSSGADVNDNDDEENVKAYKEWQKAANLLRCQIVARPEIQGAKEKSSPKVNNEGRGINYICVNYYITYERTTKLSV